MKKTILFLNKFGVAAISLLMPLFAMAQATPGAATGGGNVPYASNFTSAQNVLNFICTIFAWMFYFLIALSVVFIVIAAYRYLTASGNPEKVKSANGTILYAAIAVAVALLAKAVPLIVADFVGASGNIGACGASSSGGAIQGQPG